MDFVRQRYEVMPMRGGFEVYRYRPATTIYPDPRRMVPAGKARTATEPGGTTP